MKQIQSGKNSQKASAPGLETMEIIANSINALNLADAKTKVKSLMNEFGWKNKDILDHGDLTSTRLPEVVLPIWLRMWGAEKN